MNTEVIINATLYLRLTLLIVLFALSILSLRNMFKKARLFGLGLMFIIGSVLLSSGATYFAGIETGRLVSAVFFTIALLLWCIAWVRDLAYYDKD